MESVNTTLLKDKDENLMIRESFHQLSKLQDECIHELSNFQRENFIIHDQFRATAAKLYDMISTFNTLINKELDKLTLKINQLEITAMSAFNIISTKVIYHPGARFLACSKNKISLAEDSISVYSIDDFTLIYKMTRQEYDPIECLGKITLIESSERLYVGFNNGTVLAFSLEAPHEPIKMEYHKASISAIHQFGDLIGTGCTRGVFVLWDANDLHRVQIVSAHRLSIASIIDDGINWIVGDRTGVITIHDKMCSKTPKKTSLEQPILHLFPYDYGQYVSVFKKLYIWEGKKIIKNFNAIEIDEKVICCLKKPELLLLGSRTSTEIRLVFLNSLLFPRVLTGLIDSCPIACVHHNSIFYILTTSGFCHLIKPVV